MQLNCVKLSIVEKMYRHTENLFLGLIQNFEPILVLIRESIKKNSLLIKRLPCYIFLFEELWLVLVHSRLSGPPLIHRPLYGSNCQRTPSSIILSKENDSCILISLMFSDAIQKCQSMIILTSWNDSQSHSSILFLYEIHKQFQNVRLNSKNS